MDQCETRWAGAHPEDTCQRVVANGLHNCMLDQGHEDRCMCRCGVDGPRRKR